MFIIKSNGAMPIMKREHFLITLFLLITAIFFYLFYRILIPFVVPICWAAVFAIIFHPLYKRLCMKIRSRGIASFLICFLIVLLLFGPTAYLFTAVVQEAADAVAKVNTMYQAGEFDAMMSFDVPFIKEGKEKLSKYYDLSSIHLDSLIKDAIDKTTSVIFNQTSWLITNGSKAIFYFFLMLFTMYYFFKDGEALVNKIKRLFPIASDRVETTFHSLHEVILATMYGGLVVALIQGILGGALFAIVGIPSAVFWGAIMAFMSILPIVGAFIIYVPAGLILIIGGSYIKGLIVIGIGTLVISQSDNVIRPLLISGRTSIHPLMLFFSILGGIALLGLLGVVMGPLIAAIFVALLDTFDFHLHPKEPEPLPEADQ